MTDEGGLENIGGTSCIISLMITFNAMLNLCHSLSFLFICFLRFKFSWKYMGPLWILGNSFLDLIQFFVMLEFTFRQFKNTVSKKSLTICTSVSFYSLFVLQIVSLIIGSSEYKNWTTPNIYGLRITYLIYIILSWSFLGVLMIVTFICLIVYHYRCKHALRDADDFLLPTGKKCCCGCHTHKEKECCGNCHRCCLGAETDPRRERINNSCCCDSCCNCCIDCCIDCCGEKKVELPEGVSPNDIVAINANHHVIYTPDPNAPITMNSGNTNVESMVGLAGVGTFQDRHFVPAVFYSDLESSTPEAKAPVYIVPTDIPHQQTLFTTTMAPVIPVAPLNVSSHSLNSEEGKTQPQFVIIDGVRYKLAK